MSEGTCFPEAGKVDAKSRSSEAELGMIRPGAGRSGRNGEQWDMIRLSS